LTKDLEFNPQSTAAAIVRNSSTNGTKEWKIKIKITLDKYENN
jgi:hypothetical protein